MALIGSWRLDVGTDRLTWSEATRNLLGLNSRTPCTYHDFLEVVHEDDRAEVDGAFTGSLQDDADAGCIEHRIVRRTDGAVRVVRDSWSHERDASSTVVRTVGVMQDITEERQAEQERKRLVSILDTTSDFVSHCTPEGRLTYLNRAGRRMLGWDEDADLSERTLVDMHPAWVIRILEDTALPVAIERGVWSGETAVVTTDGGEIPVSQVIMAHLSADGSVSSFSTVIRDISAQKQVEAALRASEERFELAMRGANEGLWDWDLNTSVLYYSPRWKGMLGYAEDEIGNELSEWERLLHPDDRDRALGKVRDYLAGQAPSYDSEFRMRHKDGHYVYILSRGFGIRDAEGEVIRLVGTHVDATELKLTENALREGMERYQRLEANILGMVFCLALHPDGSYSFPYVNAGSRQLFGIEPEALMRDSSLLFERIHPDDRERRDASLRESAATLQPWRQELRHIVNGEVRWYDCMSHPHVQPNGDVVWDGIALEVTSSKQAERMLRLTQFSIEHAADAAFWTGPDAKLIYVNENACRLLGYTREELLDLTVCDLNPDFPIEAWPRHWDELQRLRSMVIESRNKTKDGRIIPVEISINLLEFEGQQYDFAFTRDITDRKRAEEEREKLEAQLRQSQKMEAIGQLAGGVAHDFNNILTAILGNVELSMDSVRGELGPDHNVIKSMVQIEQAAERASALTRQLLTFSRRDVAQPQALNLNHALADLDAMLRRLISENIVLETETDPELCSVWADPGRVEQVIVNLVVNGVQAMPDGGRLLLETKNATLDKDYARTDDEAHSHSYIMLAVSDTGHGMDAATRERIFEPFFTTKAVDKGTGLGLATVHGIVKQSGGHIVVYSEPGHGTTFKVYLPAIDHSPTDAAEVLRTSAAPGGRETVLLCEDDDPVRELTAEALRMAGYYVITAGCGEEGLAAAESHTGELGLLVTDVIMPDMNGRALSEQLRIRHPDLRTLFISGYPSNVIAHHGVLDKGVDFLEKPFTRWGLLNKVRAILDRSGASS